MWNQEDCIVALASGALPSAIAVLRLSGAGCDRKLEPCLGAFREPRKLRLTSFVDPSSGTTVDRPMCAFFPGPHSYTGEDYAEIHLHGGSYVVKEVLKILFGLGFRQANPGEFTARAVIHGKLTLSQAEGIDDLIRAASHQQWAAAQQMANGQLGEYVSKLREKLVDALSYVNARIDFPEEEEARHIDTTQVETRLVEVQKALIKLKESASSGAVRRQGLGVALVGPPNAGKSTLLNTLLQEERAIVSEVAGTTRDYLEESILLQGRLVRFIDTAGLRKTDNAIESLGIERSQTLIEKADLIVVLSPKPQDFDTPPPWMAELGLGSKKRVLYVLSKADRLQTKPVLAKGVLSISCVSGVGLDALRQRIIETVDDAVQLSGSDEICISNARHEAATSKALECVTQGLDTIKERGDDELIAFELQQAQRELVELVGDITADDLFDKIFREFCIGK